mmetsp:Transcript_34638/g.56049  ORF Transcript_34638/g.56049 Transcript_34638/m.56049 type:complete len:94 (+) Transcript_34638:1612-1893(+)
MISQQPSVSSLVNLPRTIGIAVVTSQEQSASFWYSPTPTVVYEIWLEFVAEKQPSGVGVGVGGVWTASSTASKPSYQSAYQFDRNITKIGAAK